MSQLKTNHESISDHLTRLVTDSLTGTRTLYTLATIEHQAPSTEHGARPEGACVCWSLKIEKPKTNEQTKILQLMQRRVVSGECAM